MSKNDAILMLNQHLDYLGRIDDYLSGTINDPQAKKHTDCTLGKWYYGEAKQDAKLSGHTHYGPLGEKHQAFHAITDEAIALFKAGNKAAAEAKVSEAYTLYSQISTILMELDMVEQD